MSPNRSARSPFNAWQVVAFLALGAAIGFSATLGAAPAAPKPSPTSTFREPVRAARVCVALAVYQHSATSEDWGYLALIARTLLNQYGGAAEGPDCAAGLSEALKTDFNRRRWQLALDVFDAVQSGDYSVAPAACARADKIVPIDPAAPVTPPDAAAAARAQCVLYDLAFVGGDA